jgi:6-phosphogluconate dehydrogenase (decarboxylating)
LAKKGIMFLGMGISGGEEGARNGPSLMPGGPKEAFDLIAPIMSKCAAQAGEPSMACFGYLGPIGAGNYVKMVHNGIEYGDMQLISEVYDILKVWTVPYKRKCYCRRLYETKVQTRPSILSIADFESTGPDSFSHHFLFLCLFSSRRT